MLKDKERPLALKLVLSEFSTLFFNQHNPVPRAIPISEKRKRKPPNSRGPQSLKSECHRPLSPGKKLESGTAAQTRILSSDKHGSVCFLVHKEDELMSRDLTDCAQVQMDRRRYTSCSVTRGTEMQKSADAPKHKNKLDASGIL